VSWNAVSIRPERDGDEAGVDRVIRRAFAGHPHSDGREADILARLRACHDIDAALVAVTRFGRIVGQIAFTPVTIGGRECDWCGLGPLSVVPRHQRRGIGTRLVEEGLAGLRRLGMAGCVVLGDPGFYGRFGFHCDPHLTYADAPPEYFQRLVLHGDEPQGEVRYAEAFG
jgi:putative acetyltransferase